MATQESPLRYLAMTKIGEKGQLTVPKQFRRDLGLGAGAPFAVLRLGDGLILLPEQQRFEKLCEAVDSRLVSAGLSREDLLGTLSKARDRVFARHYGDSSNGRRRRARRRSAK